ncbi:MAG: hypothetical protein MJ247_04055 [Alphaproteobacteria bacterium]|nr:hypothetical protein [Alphaproteobacteria bacterium]
MSDVIRDEFIDMYEDALAECMDNHEDELDETEMKKIRIEAMVNAALEIRSTMDPVLQKKLKDLKNLRDFKQLLLTEFKMFAEIDPSKLEPIFAEYMLFSLLHEFEVEDHIDFDVFGEELNDAFRKMKPDYQDLHRVFPWGKLVDLN